MATNKTIEQIMPTGLPTFFCHREYGRRKTQEKPFRVGGQTLHTACDENRGIGFPKTEQVVSTLSVTRVLVPSKRHVHRAEGRSEMKTEKALFVVFLLVVFIFGLGFMFGMETTSAGCREAAERVYR